jgi:hypothetical protein
MVIKYNFFSFYVNHIGTGTGILTVIFLYFNKKN